MNKTKLFKLCKMIMSFKEYDTEKGKLILDGDLVEGTEVSILDEDGEVIPALDGEYEIEGQKVIVAEGKIASIEVIEEAPVEEPEQEEIPSEEAPVEQPAEEPTEDPAEDPSQEGEPTEEAPAEEPAVNPELEEANRVIEEQAAHIAELEARIAELEAELNKPVEEPLQMKAVVKEEAKDVKTGALRYF